ncbi:hypothetical protein F6W70_03745 [Microbacterium maritypicum]|uniref:Uncharacterized protein n=1 Tax=Microbacterium maritypicum TaxID=33918 RepID=A0AAD3X3D5_MICMQ|nr:hypothetical protein [Microbacterium liquefaciens]KAB1886569.1 hypothetical protein F6W70_03745 [Microbacterium liquefaciens]
MNLVPDARAVITALTITVLGAMISRIQPTARWSRQLERDQNIMDRVTGSRERRAWQASYDERARNLRVYRERAGVAENVLPTLIVLGMFLWVNLFIVDPVGRAVVVANGELMISLSTAVAIAGSYLLYAFASGRFTMPRGA